MPFGKKRDARQPYEIDFDRVYELGIKPAFEGLPVDYIRADEERGGGMIHLPMFERLLLAEIAIVDVTSENANVFYELGVRHAARPHSTIILRGGDGGLPFDINMMRAVTYKLDGGILSEAAGAELAKALAARLETALSAVESKDSPLFQLIPSYPGITLPAHAAETFREREQQLETFRRRLAEARRRKSEGLAEIIAVEQELGEISEANAELVIDLVLTYRDAGTQAAFERLIALVERMPESLRARSVPVMQQYALALNRRNQGSDRHRALEVLENLCAQNGETAETCGIVGRIYKDYSNEARRAGQKARAAGHLLAAIDYYRRGFNADPRDFYPGVNLATALTMEGSPESSEELKRILPAVAFAVARRDALDKNNYWTIATLLEVAVLGDDWPAANRALARMLALPDLSPFDLQSTARQLATVRSYESRDVDPAELDKIVLELLANLPPESVGAVLEPLPDDTLKAYRGALGEPGLAALAPQLAPELLAKLQNA